MNRLDKSETHIYQGLLIAFAVVIVIVAAGSILLINSAIAPLIIGGALLVIAMAIIFVRKPIWAMYAALLIVLLPIGLLPATIQSNLNRLLTVIAFIAWGYSLFRQRRPIVWTVSSVIMMAFLLWCLITLFHAPNLTMAKDTIGAYLLRFVLFLLLFANLVNDRKTLDGVMIVLSIAGWLFVTTGVVSLVTRGYEVGTRLQILEGNENTLGGLFPIVVIGVIWMARRKNHLHKSFWFLMSVLFILLSFLLIALNGSRGGAISWVLTMIVLLIWKQTRPWGMIGILIFLIGAISAPFIMATTIDRFSALSPDSILGGREALWKAAWMLIRENLLFGSGVGNSRYVMMYYVRLFIGVGSRETVAIHNPILTIWVDTGLIGLMLYLGVLISAVWSFVNQYQRFKSIDTHWLLPYFSLTSAALCGYLSTWIKGGGIEISHTYFLILALLIIPSQIIIDTTPTGLPT